MEKKIGVKEPFDVPLGDRPIVNRPESWAQKGCECVGCLRDRELFSYIDHLEYVNKNLRESARILKEMADPINVRR